MHHGWHVHPILPHHVPTDRGYHAYLLFQRLYHIPRGGPGDITPSTPRHVLRNFLSLALHVTQKSLQPHLQVDLQP